MAARCIFPVLGRSSCPGSGESIHVECTRSMECISIPNRGLGTAEIEFRYDCPAEISLFEVYPPLSSAEQDCSHLDSF